MNPQGRLTSVLNRIACGTGVLRVRAADIDRTDRNGGSSAELRERVELLIEKLEKVAADLEDAIA
jgi:hypothetical protein